MTFWKNPWGSPVNGPRKAHRNQWTPSTLTKKTQLDAGGPAAFSMTRCLNRSIFSNYALHCKLCACLCAVHCLLSLCMHLCTSLCACPMRASLSTFPAHASMHHTVYFPCAFRCALSLCMPLCISLSTFPMQSSCAERNDFTGRTLRFLVLYFGCAMHSICSRCTALSARTVQQSLDASITEEPRNCEAPKNCSQEKCADEWKQGRDPTLAMQASYPARKFERSGMGEKSDMAECSAAISFSTPWSPQTCRGLR